MNENNPEQDGTLALTLAYNGADFHGFARQPGQVTVQGELEKALRTLFNREIETVGAGRTDVGVHALGQVVSFELAEQDYTEFKNAKRSFEPHSLKKLRSSLNALTPEGIVVRDVVEKPPGFSARFSAQEREYRYRYVFSEVEPLFLRPYTWWVSPRCPIDVQAMKRAAPLLVGEHDFASFCVAASAVDRNTVRRILSITIFGTDHLGESCLVLQVRGTAFLHSMIRVIAGSLLEVGLGKREPSWFEEVLRARDRTAAGQTAPAQGLTFWRVRY
ncbi:MAG: tRNA pseudouridine(38-40) synthase TruA [Coriobacteriales bacterium]|jgi:tRNA pseudouridine38-40 synthase|nr:tRNA pseudouridine(38-40) synthase TruA [Coriobacteriales bacterium]